MGQKLPGVLEKMRQVATAPKPKAAAPAPTKGLNNSPTPKEPWADRVKSEHARLFGSGAKMSHNAEPLTLQDSPAEQALKFRPRASTAGKDIELKSEHTITWDKPKKK